jgi:hypothetical protein
MTTGRHSTNYRLDPLNPRLVRWQKLGSGVTDLGGMLPE